jgi:cytochrome c oxidase assembly protein subunit 15
VQLAQGVVGYVQYFTDLPIALVLLHMLGAVLVTALTARLVWSVRGPVEAPSAHRPTPRPAAVPQVR